MIVSSSYLRNLLVVWSVSASAQLSYQGLWAVSWYRTAYGVPASEARNWASLISIGMFLGTVMLGRFWGGLNSGSGRCASGPFSTASHGRPFCSR